MAVLALPAVETKVLAELREQRDTAQARANELVKTLPAARAMAEVSDFEYGDAYREQMRELRSAQTLVGDYERSFRNGLDERRREVARQVVASRPYRNALEAAVMARAERLTPEGELVALHMRAAQDGVTLSPGLPAALVAEIDGLVRWGKELRRLDMIELKRLPAWLREQVES